MTTSLLPILRIADFNTKGLIGPATAGTPFHSLVKSSGVSKKDSEASGGSFGIGKNAVYSLSDLQTVFYSTVYRNTEDGALTFLAQGKSVLVSHTDREGTSRRATGYWGEPNFQPINDPSRAPKWLRRDEVGTTVFAIGFREAGGWKERMAASLIQNFFSAIHREDMELYVGDELIIDSKSISSLFADPRIQDAATQTISNDEFAFSKYLYECLTSSEAFAEEIQVEHLGGVRVRVLVRAGLPKRVTLTDGSCHFHHNG